MGGGGGTGPVSGFTPVQHQYPRGPFSKKCWISQFFDKIGNAGTAHRALDVILDNGTGTAGQNPAPGEPVYAMEAGTVVKVVSTAGPSPQGFPACQGLHVAGNRVNVKDSAGYITVYYHMMPLASIAVGQSITQGQQLGTLDTSGCQKAPHSHIQRFDPSLVIVNFTIPCSNSLPTTKLGDGLVDDDDTDVP